MDFESFKQMLLNCFNSEYVLDTLSDKIGNYYKFKDVLALEFMEKKEIEMKFLTFGNGI